MVAWNPMQHVHEFLDGTHRTIVASAAACIVWWAGTAWRSGSALGALGGGVVCWHSIEIVLLLGH